MVQDNRLSIGQATYEISRVFSNTLSISDIIREIVVSKSKKAEN